MSELDSTAMTKMTEQTKYLNSSRKRIQISTEKVWALTIINLAGRCSSVGAWTVHWNVLFSINQKKKKESGYKAPTQRRAIEFLKSEMPNTLIQPFSNWLIEDLQVKEETGS